MRPRGGRAAGAAHRIAIVETGSARVFVYEIAEREDIVGIAISGAAVLRDGVSRGKKLLFLKMSNNGR